MECLMKPRPLFLLSILLFKVHQTKGHNCDINLPARSNKVEP